MLIRVWDDVYILNQMQTFTNFSNPTRKLNDFLITTKINNSTEDYQEANRLMSFREV